MKYIETEKTGGMGEWRWQLAKLAGSSRRTRPQILLMLPVAPFDFRKNCRHRRRASTVRGGAKEIVRRKTCGTRLKERRASAKD